MNSQKNETKQKKKKIIKENNIKEEHKEKIKNVILKLRQRHKLGYSLSINIYKLDFILLTFYIRYKLKNLNNRDSGLTST